MIVALYQNMSVNDANDLMKIIDSLAQSAPYLRGELIAFSKYRENSSPYSAIVNHESYVDEYLQKEKK